MISLSGFSRSVCAVAALMVATRAAGAQSIITAPKAAAQRAVAATNANTNAQTSVTATPTPTPAATKPGAAAAAPTVTPSKTVVHNGSTPTAAAPAPSVVAVKPVPGKPGAPTTVPAKPAPVAAAPGKPAPVAAAAPLKPVAPAVVAKGKPLPAGKGAAAVGPATDSGSRSISVTERGVKGEVTLSREVYSYEPGGRRDPFASLMRTGDLRPMLSDLRLVVVLYDPTGRNSIGIMRDVATKDQYRVKVGQTLGRMRVAQIQPKQIVFTIEEVGFSRQEALAVGDSSLARTQ
jgi:hypothetical protein